MCCSSIVASPRQEAAREELPPSVSCDSEQTLPQRAKLSNPNGEATAVDHTGRAILEIISSKGEMIRRWWSEIYA